MMLNEFSNIKKDKCLEKNYSIPELNDNITNCSTFTFSTLNTNSDLLSIPIFSLDSNQKITCSLNKMKFNIGPICPFYYSKPIEINLISFIKEKIYCKIQTNSIYQNLLKISNQKDFIQLNIFLPKEPIKQIEKKVIQSEILISKNYKQKIEDIHI